MHTNNYYSRNSIGLFDILNELTSLNSIEPTYPPYNIIKLTDDKYKIELAMAGFKKDNITVTVNDNQLLIDAKYDEMFNNSEEYIPSEDDESHSVQPNTLQLEYLHKGISQKDITRKFLLCEYFEVNEVSFIDGLLSIFVIKNIPEEKRPRRIPIS